MKKKIYFILSFLLILMIGGCSKYEELNNLSIISNITITYKDGLYIVSMQEIIPQKGENKINYDYKYIDSVLKENKRTLYKVSGIYKKKKRLRIPLIKINDKELIFSKFIYLQV